MTRLDLDVGTWSQLSTLLDAALDLPPPDRASWLAALDARHDAIKPRLEQLLARAAQIETGFLAALPRLDELAPPSGSAVAEGQCVGPYRLLSEIGVGGMGSVWLAERVDGLISRRVALKFPRGVWIHAGLRERMAREREILASLEHPGIARLYDAGLTESGDPYLALEYVAGRPLDVYCAGERLGVRARLELFLQIADAVAYAHSKLIIHRDLKPANILVTPEGDARLLDFGVGKLLDEQQARDARLTELSGQALTPDYASPEQIAGRPLTVATDVYSLGVILYELLTEKRPYRLKRDSRGALEDAILEADPQRPSQAANTTTLRKELAGDLDAITLRALSKNPEERYASVADLAADLRRYLKDEPVAARADAWPYRARKFVRRHRGAVAVAATVAAALVTVSGVTALQSIEARRQRDAAIYQQQRAQAANEFMNLMLTEIGPGGRPLTHVELLDRGVTMLERQYGTEQRFLGPMLYQLANGYFSLGMTDRLVDLLERAEQTARADDDADLLAAVLCTLARVRLREEPDTARQHALEGREALANVAVPSTDSIVSCARADATILQLQGEPQAAVATLRAALDALDANPAASVQSRLYVMNELAALYYNQRRLDETLALTDEVLDLMTRSGRGGTVGYLVNASNRAAVFHVLGEVKTAFEIRSGLLERVQALDRAEQPLGVWADYASSLLRLARYDEALRIFEDERDGARSAGNENLAAQFELQIGRALMLMGRHAEANESLDSAEAVLRMGGGANERLTELLALTRAETRLGLGDADGARSAVEAELRRLGHPQRTDHPGLYDALRVAATIALQTEDFAAAEAHADGFQALAAARARDPELSADVGEALLLRAQARQSLGNAAGARSDLERALPSLRNGLGDDHPSTRLAQSLL